MNPEEMREELESFVNQGLQEGWNGWPLKGWSFDAGRGWLGVQDRGVESLRFTREESFLAGDRFQRLFRMYFRDVAGLS